MLKCLRMAISLLDRLIIHLLAFRMRFALGIEKCKRQNGDRIYNPTVEEEKLKKIEAIAVKRNVHAIFPGGVRELFKKIFSLSRKLQEEQRKSAK